MPCQNVSKCASTAGLLAERLGLHATPPAAGEASGCHADWQMPLECRPLVTNCRLYALERDMVVPCLHATHTPPDAVILAAGIVLWCPARCRTLPETPASPCQTAGTGAGTPPHGTCSGPWLACESWALCSSACQHSLSVISWHNAVNSPLSSWKEGCQ